VEVQGLTPGRYVRCAFCDALVEVPYLRRADATWKRRRFTRPKLVIWAWAALAVITAIALLGGGVRFLKRQQRSAQERSIKNLLESSRRNDADGRLGEALVDLDTAIELARNEGSAALERLGDYRKRRQDLARRDAEARLESLRQDVGASFALGDWLNLIARAERDPDLAPLSKPIGAQFQASLLRQVDADLQRARQLFESGDALAAMDLCDRLGGLIKHLDENSQPSARSKAELFVRELIARHGVTIEAPEGHFVFGSQASYLAKMKPALVQALAAKGYLAYREKSAWNDLWAQAPYHLHLDITERLEGNYLSSQNRLTWIEAHLTFVRPGAPPWQAMPAARSTVPLPGMSAFASSRLAASPKRLEEVERVLYDDARAQIDARFAYALSSLPRCARAGATGGLSQSGTGEK
jgi:hypothetical protein